MNKRNTSLATSDVFPNSREKLFLGPAKTVSALLITFYWISVWDLPLPFFRTLDWTWYLVLGIGAFAFLLQSNRVISHNPAILYFQVSILLMLGGLLGLFRSDNWYQILYNSVGQVITICSFFLFSQLLQYRQVRRMIFWTLIFAAILWGIQIINVSITLGERARYAFHSLSTTGGHDKNFLSLLLAMASISLLSYSLFSNAVDGKGKLLRLITFTLALGFVFVCSLLYSRSGLLTILISVSISLTIYFLKRPSGRLAVILLVPITLILFISLLLDDYLQVFPFWRTNVERISTVQQLEDFNAGRVYTLQKSFGIIVENPIIGIGTGMYKTTHVDINSRHAEGTTAHNTYLAQIAEGGLLSTIAFILWITSFLHVFRTKFELLDNADRGLMFMSIPFFVMLTFIDSGMIHFILLLHSCIYFDYKDSQQK